MHLITAAGDIALEIPLPSWGDTNCCAGDVHSPQCPSFLPLDVDLDQEHWTEIEGAVKGGFAPCWGWWIAIPSEFCAFTALLGKTFIPPHVTTPEHRATASTANAKHFLFWNPYKAWDTALKTARSTQRRTLLNGWEGEHQFLLFWGPRGSALGCWCPWCDPPRLVAAGVTGWRWPRKPLASHLLQWCSLVQYPPCRRRQEKWSMTF